MFLITSGAYIDSEFASEIGMLPPAFLPLGNKFLFEHQAEIAKRVDNDIVISIPKSYSLSEIQIQRLKALSIRIVTVDENVTLGESICLCINKIEDKILYVLHGDTLFKQLDTGLDCTYISKNIGYYKRAFLENGIIKNGFIGDEKDVLCGYFSFQSSNDFLKCLKITNSNFIGALNLYNEKYSIDFKSANDWYDFGHLNAYFNSRASYTTERSFNILKLQSDLVVKSSYKIKKILGEAMWFENLPENLQLYTPKLIKIEKNQNDSLLASYTLEYLFNLPLSDLYVYGSLSSDIWTSIFNSCRKFLELAKKNVLRERDLNTINFKLEDIYNKTVNRLELYQTSTDFNINCEFYVNNIRCYSLLKIAKETYELIRGNDADDLVIIHGDFCLSNILYDFRTRRIKVIDPRGIDFNENITNLGDQRYDLAKLYHSIYGLYDFIIAGHLNITRSANTITFEILGNKGLKEIQASFDKIFFNNNHELKYFIHILTIHLFLSMLPLHEDRPDRQDAMIATIAKLYFDLKENYQCL